MLYNCVDHGAPFAKAAEEHGALLSRFLAFVELRQRVAAARPRRIPDQLGLPPLHLQLEAMADRHVGWRVASTAPPVTSPNRSPANGCWSLVERKAQVGTCHAQVSARIDTCMMYVCRHTIKKQINKMCRFERPQLFS